MATRRMISRDVINSGDFIRLSALSQLLWMRICIDADDDGFCDSSIQEIVTHATTNEIKELCDAGFLTPVPDTRSVFHIPQWRLMNTVRADCYHESQYYDLLPTLYPETYTQHFPPWEVKEPSPRR